MSECFISYKCNIGLWNHWIVWYGLFNWCIVLPCHSRKHTGVNNYMYLWRLNSMQVTVPVLYLCACIWLVYWVIQMELIDINYTCVFHVVASKNVCHEVMRIICSGFRSNQILTQLNMKQMIEQCTPPQSSKHRMREYLLHHNIFHTCMRLHVTCMHTLNYKGDWVRQVKEVKSFLNIFFIKHLLCHPCLVNNIQI